MTIRWSLRNCGNRNKGQKIQILGVSPPIPHLPCHVNDTECVHLVDSA